MKIVLGKIPVRDIVDQYSDDGEGGVRGYSGKLDIRPSFQREFVYNETQRAAVINTVTRGLPLNVMYWAVRDDGSYEIIDGQQRTISIAQYVSGDFSYNKLYFHSLTDDRQREILDYELMVYKCTGTDSEKLEWFKVVNIAGAKLTNQELRNAVYAGTWVSDAKRYFSRTGGPAYQLGKDYLGGKAIRQEYLETAIRWISKGEIEDYMSRHQHDPTAVAIWKHFQSIISWVAATFTEKRREMKSVDWGGLYDEYKDAHLDPAVIEEEIAELMMDDDVTKKSGIYPYVLTRQERYLNIRLFSNTMKRAAYERQKRICKMCVEQFQLNEMEADHIIPWIEGGKTDAENCQMLCRACNRRKSSK